MKTVKSGKKTVSFCGVYKKYIYRYVYTMYSETLLKLTKLLVLSEI